MDAAAPKRVELRAIDVAEAERIITRSPRPDDRWADDFPFEGDVVAITAFLRASENIEQRPFGYYRITCAADGVAIGGIGFRGHPEDGCVEFGYGLVPSARGNGYAAEAVAILLRTAAELGVSRMIAHTESDNAASQKTLVKAGLRLEDTTGKVRRYEVVIDQWQVR